MAYMTVHGIQREDVTYPLAAGVYGSDISTAFLPGRGVRCAGGHLTILAYMPSTLGTQRSYHMELPCMCALAVVRILPPSVLSS
jgi:hypothetical protein